MQAVASTLINAITGKGAMRAEKGQGGFLSLLTIILPMKALGQGVRRAARGYNNLDHMDKNFKFNSILKEISKLRSTPITNLGLMVFL